MVTTNSDLLVQLRNAISGWTTEVGSAHETLSGQIDGANGQLGRLLNALQERNGNAVALAEAHEEIERLKRERDAEEMPPGTVTHYAAGAEPNLDAVRKELESTVDRLRSAIQIWTHEVTESQGGLVEQFKLTNSQLNRLLAVLDTTPESLDPDPAGTQAELDQLRHERDVLTDEVHALNIEVETLRQDQESFATANLDAESDQQRKQQATLEHLQQALAERDTIIDDCQSLLEDSQRIESTLTGEIAELEQKLSTYAQSGKQLQDSLEQEKSTSTRQLEELSTLREEASALREALVSDADRLPAIQSDVTAPALDSDSLDAAKLRITELESALAEQPEAQNEAPGPSTERITELESLVEELEARPTQESLDAANRQVAKLETDLTEQAELTTEAPETDSERVSELEALVEELETRPTKELMDAANGRIAELETALAELPGKVETGLDLAESSDGPDEGTENTLQKPSISAEDQASLNAAMAQLEEELDSLKLREEESVATARTLLQELETHRNFEAAQEEALALARTESEGLRTSLENGRAEIAQMKALLESGGGETTASAESGIAEADADRIRSERDDQLREATSELQEKVDALDKARAEIEMLQAAREKGREAESPDEALQVLLDKQAEELREYRDSGLASDKRIEELEAQLVKTEQSNAQLSESEIALNLASTEADKAHEISIGELQEEVTRLQTDLANRSDELNQLSTTHKRTEQSLESAQNRESELLQERDQIAAALDNASAEKVEHEAVLADATSTLESQQAALRERDERIDSFRRDVGELTRELQTLAGKEELAQRQTSDLKASLNEIQASDALHVEDLEKNRALLEKMRGEHQAQERAVADLSSRGDQLEGLLDNARQDETAALATVDELHAQVSALQEKEVAESRALDKTRSLVMEHKEKLHEREDHVSALEQQLAVVLEEKDILSKTAVEQDLEMRTTMSQVSEVIAERDELRDALEKTGEVKERIHAGEAGSGLGAEDAAVALEQRTRQQDILVSELVHSEEGRSLGNILVAAEVISADQLSKSLEIQKNDPSQLLGTILIDNEFTTDDAIAQAVACQLGRPAVNPMETHIQPQATDLLNGDICTWHVCIPLRVSDERLVVAMANPLDESAVLKLRDVSGREITTVVAPASQIISAVESHYGTF